jgi:hypothetical protein
MSTKHFKVELKKALDLLGKIGFLASWAFKEDLVSVKRRY